MTEASRFAVASVTKMVTATTALRLVERGAIRLDQPLVEILPDEHQPTALTPAHTLHHLLSHTSGLRNYHDDEDPTWDSFTSCWDRVPTYRIRRPADMLPLFRDLPAVRPPGVAYEYADANFILVGLAIEATSGRPFAEAATGEVLRPAGMHDTSSTCSTRTRPGWPPDTCTLAARSRPGGRTSSACRPVECPTAV